MTKTQSIKVLYDTDIGSDIDDAVALAYLLAEPRCGLVGITTVSGRAEERAMLASALCQVAGKPALPIYPGVEHPLLLQQQHQPTAPQIEALGRRPHTTAFPQGEARRKRYWVNGTGIPWPKPAATCCDKEYKKRERR